MLEKYVDPSQNQRVFEAIDEELARRIGQNSFEAEHFAKVMEIMANHNLLCPTDYEIILEMFIDQSEAFAIENFGSFTKD